MTSATPLLRKAQRQVEEIGIDCQQTPKPAAPFSDEILGGLLNVGTTSSQDSVASVGQPGFRPLRMRTLLQRTLFYQGLRAHLHRLCPHWTIDAINTHANIDGITLARVV